MTDDVSAPAEPFYRLSRTYIPPVEVDPGRTALVIVDMQYFDAAADQGFAEAMERLEPGSADYFNERNEGTVVPALTRLVAGFREREMPIVYVMSGSEHRDLRDVPARMRTFLRTIEERSGVEDILWSQSPTYAVRREFAPRAEDTIVKKTTFGAFASSTLDETLRAMEIDTLLVTGVTTNCCISSSVRDAADLGYSCIVVEECTADYDQNTHDVAIAGLYFNFARILRTPEEVLDAIDQRAAV